ncbi:hypothetical protein QQ020_01400 [Fulvivirgaceae bacterium BMA12]|uniref:Uncharacterized protein n=1 Tax=Agaribacillus aureus TaxID=3051825 RepID=A0ABT8KZ06_9BACT|nr:hypothetical protein [Fulvivirgaceae bacterium BMA12]
MGNNKHIIQNFIAIKKISAPETGADIVELNPKRENINITAMIAAKFLNEIVMISKVP